MVINRQEAVTQGKVMFVGRGVFRIRILRQPLVPLRLGLGWLLSPEDKLLEGRSLGFFWMLEWFLACLMKGNTDLHFMMHIKEGWESELVSSI